MITSELIRDTPYVVPMPCSQRLINCGTAGNPRVRQQQLQPGDVKDTKQPLQDA